MSTASRPQQPATLDILRVFVGDDPAMGGNLLGVFLDPGAVPAALQQQVAADLGYSETVFVEDTSRAALRIFTPATELPFAGHPLVGTSWLLAARGQRVTVLRPRAGEVATWSEDAVTWIRGRAGWAPVMHLLQLRDPAAVEAMEGAPEGDGFVYAWAWIDEAAGIVRSRAFAPELGVAEDEATGAAAVRLGDALGRPLRIHQGRGSVLLARPGPDGTVEVGGRVLPVETRAYPLPALGGAST